MRRLMIGKTTIKETAGHADVGATTESRVLNDHPYVSDEKRRRVEQAIAALDYHPSQTARHLRGSPSGLLGFLTDDVAVIGFDNIAHIAEGLLPALTTMQLPHYEMGRWAVQYLMGNQGKGSEPVQVALPCPLVRRESV